MQILSDLKNDLVERFSNIFISAYILSFFAWNWKIPIALFFLKTIDVKAEGYVSYFDLITQVLRKPLCFWAPFIFAVAYTLAMPIIRRAVLWYQAIMKARSLKEVNKVLSYATVPMSKYIDKINELETKKRRLEQVIASESISLDEIKSLNLEISNLKRQNESNEASIQLWQKSLDTALLNGSWVLEYKRINSSLEEVVESKKLEIRDGEVSEISGIDRQIERVFRITHFFIHPSGSYVYFLLQSNNYADASVFLSGGITEGLKELRMTSHLGMPYLFTKA